MNIRVLGALEAEIDHRPVRLGAAKPRAVLAILALHPGAIVSTDRLIEGLWGEQPPATAVKLVQLYVSQLRKALAESGDGKAIVTRGHGYQLQLAPADVDAGHFEQLLAEGAPREALALWRGPPLDDVADEPFAAAEIRRLEELRLAALELAIDADLTAGRQVEVLHEIDVLIAQEPLREPLHARRMLALYRCGRQAEALAAYREARRVLVEQAGIEPGPQLRRLHEAILGQDPTLEGPGTVADWARDAATRRVDAAVGQAASGRAELRAAEIEVAGGVEELQATRTAGDRIVACPFKGLASFDIDDAEVFFGRERLVSEMVARLAGAPLMAVVGPSGSGKSSALRAGLLAALAAGVLPGSEGWTIVVLRPGNHPLRALEQATAGTAGRVVLAVDQFEEVFTACGDERERAGFAAQLAERAEDPRRRTLVLIAVRADFYGQCAAYPELARLLGASHVLVGSMRRDELRRAIELPARQAGLLVEPNLTDALVADVAGEPGALPLLSSSLLELWQRRDGHRLRLDAYDQTGGVRGAVARLAERAYERLDADRRAVARRILLRLAQGEGDAVVRRRVPLSELEGDGVEETLAVLADQRLVTIGDGEVEVAHETLLREWPRLRAWLQEDAEARRVHTHLIGAAHDWEAAGRDTGELYRGARLAAALEWAGTHESDPNASERAFLAAGHARAERAAERQRQANRRLRALLGSLAILLAVAVVAGAVAISQRGDARNAALAADAQRLGAQALTDDRLDHALLLARVGVALDETSATLGNLLSVLQRSPAEVAEFRGQGTPLYPVAVSPDQERLALGDEAGFVTVYDLRSRRRVSLYRLPVDGALVQRLRFSPDSNTLAVAGYAGGRYNRPEVDLIDPATGTRRLRITPPAVPGNPSLVVLSPVFAPNGRDLLILQSPVSSGDPASTLRRFDGRTGAEQRRPLRLGPHSAVGRFSTTSDRRRAFATSPGDGRSYEIDADRLRVIAQWPVGGRAGAVSPDGSVYALGFDDGAVRLLDLHTNRVRTLPQRLRAGVKNLVFTPDGGTLATGDTDGAVTVWDVATGAVREQLTGHTDEIQGMDVSADGRTLYAASSDTRVIAWDLVGGWRLDRRFAAGPPFVIDDESPRGVAISPDGRRLAVTQADGTVNLLDTVTLAPLARFRALDGYAAAVEFSPDGRTIAVTGERGRVTLWDARDLRAAGELRGLPPAHAQALAFSGDGRLLAGATIASPGDSEVQIWDVASRARTHVRFRALASSLAFSPRGRLLAAAGAQYPTQVRDARTGRLVAALRTAGEGRSVAFSPDGTLLATGLFNGEIQLWSTRSWTPVEPALEGHSGRVTTVEFAPSGRLLLSAGADGTLQLWDVATRTPVGSPQPVEPNSYVAAIFAPDGERVFAVSAGTSGLRWELSSAAWKQHACDIAGRELTAREWSDALPGRAYRAACHGG